MTSRVLELLQRHERLGSRWTFAPGLLVVIASHLVPGVAVVPSPALGLYVPIFQHNFCRAITGWRVGRSGRGPTCRGRKYRQS